jgi:hypothetical protein
MATLAALAGRPSSARAEDDAGLVAMPARSVAVGMQVHGSRIAGRSEGGVGPLLELAVGRARWQYLVEASIATATLTDDTAALIADRQIDGRMARAAGGVRWLARQFAPASAGGFELFLAGMVGMHRYYFDDGGRLTRPEVALGVGIQGRAYRSPRFAFRIDARVVFTPSEREAQLGSCTDACMAGAASTGFMSGIVLAW